MVIAPAFFKFRRAWPQPPAPASPSPASARRTSNLQWVAIERPTPIGILPGWLTDPGRRPVERFRHRRCPRPDFCSKQPSASVVVGSFNFFPIISPRNGSLHVSVLAGRTWSTAHAAYSFVSDATNDHHDRSFAYTGAQTGFESCGCRVASTLSRVKSRVALITSRWTPSSLHKRPRRLLRAAVVLDTPPDDQTNEVAVYDPP